MEESEEDRVDHILHLDQRGREIAHHRVEKRRQQKEDILNDLENTLIENAKNSNEPFDQANVASVIEKVRHHHSPGSAIHKSNTKVIPAEVEHELEKAAEAQEEQLEEEGKDEGLSMLEIFFLSCLLFALFFSDFWDLFNHSESEDPIRNSVLLVLFGIFIAEIFITCSKDHYYIGTAFFYLDIIGTCVIILDLTWISNWISQGSTVSILRATRASKIGARSRDVFNFFKNTGKLFRGIRLIINAAFKGIKIHGPVSEHDKVYRSSFKPSLNPRQRIVSADLEGKRSQVNEAFSFRIAVIVMVLIIVVPFLQYNAIDYSPNSWMTTLRIIGKNNSTTTNDIEMFATKIKKFYHIHDDQLYSLKFECPWIETTFQEKYETKNKIVRYNNIVKYSSMYKISNKDLLASSNPYANQKIQQPTCLSCYSYFTVEIQMDVTAETKMSSLLSILSTLLVILVLFFGTSTITTSMEALVLIPLRDALIGENGNVVETLRVFPNEENSEKNITVEAQSNK